MLSHLPVPQTKPVPVTDDGGWYTDHTLALFYLTVGYRAPPKVIAYATNVSVPPLRYAPRADHVFVPTIPSWVGP